MSAAEVLFDEQLLEYALLVSRIHTDIPSTGSDLKPKIFPDAGVDNSPEFQSTLVLQVFSSERELLFNFNTQSPEPLVTLEAGYADVNFDGYRWHAFTYFEPSQERWIIAAQRDDIRYTLAESVILESVLPIVLGIPVAGILVWLLTGIGMTPIRRLANALQTKEATDLGPINIEGSPSELIPLQNSTNELLERLQGSFNREKRFAADAAHELRTPISILKVQIHNLLEDMQEPSASIRQLKIGIDRMGHLVEQILDLNRTAPDLYMAQFNDLNLYEVCQGVVSDIYQQFAAKNQSFELVGTDLRIRGDQFAIAILLKNLLSNASKYTQDGGQIKVVLSENDREVILQVIDNGPGIPEAERERALERFYRTGGDRHASKESGCGLGLAIVKHIVDMHNAKINLEDPAGGEGLCVTIRFASHDEIKKHEQ